MIYIRHGESEHNVGLTKSLDSGLTARGIKQAHAAGRELLEKHILVSRFLVYGGLVSPLRRTRQTADIITQYTGIPFVVCPLLRDWSSDVTVDGILYRHETAEEAQGRLVRVWQDIIAPRDNQFIVVSHQAPIAVFLQLDEQQAPNVHKYHHVENGKVYCKP